ncbi:MAG: hypothetical protein MZV64_68060 [Ignavibacteriales bacterium]|nr:hypothetical protein [Ignavibacteriales bacterium]
MPPAGVEKASAERPVACEVDLSRHARGRRWPSVRSARGSTSWSRSASTNLTRNRRRQPGPDPPRGLAGCQITNPRLFDRRARARWLVTTTRMSATTASIPISTSAPAREKVFTRGAQRLLQRPLLPAGHQPSRSMYDAAVHANSDRAMGGDRPLRRCPPTQKTRRCCWARTARPLALLFWLAAAAASVSTTPLAGAASARTASSWARGLAADEPVALPARASAVPERFSEVLVQYRGPAFLRAIRGVDPAGARPRPVRQNLRRDGVVERRQHPDHAGGAAGPQEPAAAPTSRKLTRDRAGPAPGDGPLRRTRSWTLLRGQRPLRRQHRRASTRPPGSTSAAAPESPELGRGRLPGRPAQRSRLLGSGGRAASALQGQARPPAAAPARRRQLAPASSARLALAEPMPDGSRSVPRLAPAPPRHPGGARPGERLVPVRSSTRGLQETVPAHRRSADGERLLERNIRNLAALVIDNRQGTVVGLCRQRRPRAPGRAWAGRRHAAAARAARAASSSRSSTPPCSRRAA